MFEYASDTSDTLSLKLRVGLMYAQFVEKYINRLSEVLRESLPEKQENQIDDRTAEEAPATCLQDYLITRDNQCRWRPERGN